MSFVERPDAYAKPPAYLRTLFKEYHRRSNLGDDVDIVDFGRGLTRQQQSNIRVIGSITKEQSTAAFHDFEQRSNVPSIKPAGLDFKETGTDVSIYEHRYFPGWRIKLS